MIRTAEENDAKKIVYINIMSWKETYKGIFPKDFLDNLNPNDVDSIQKCKKKIHEYIVYEIDGKVVGFVRYGLNKKNYSKEYGEIYALYVDENYKNKGIGSKLINYTFNILKEKYNKVLISTLQGNSANTFYKKMGGKNIDICKFKLQDKEYIENLYEYDLMN